jgi:hypothetical protein
MAAEKHPTGGIAAATPPPIKATKAAEVRKVGKTKAT